MNIATHSPALIIAIPLLGAFLTPLIGKLGRRVRDAFVLIILILTSIIGIILAQQVYSEGVVEYVFGGSSPSINSSTTSSIPIVRIIFEIDGMSIFMAMISLLLAFFAALYSTSFIKDENGSDRYYTLLLLLLVGMLGMELTGDMFNFFVFIEIASISASALIAFSVDRGESLEAAIKYLAISSIGALFLLFAVGLLYGQYDALNMAMIANSLSNTYIDKIALILLIGSLAMKSGIAPMHMWMPDAYGEAPSSVTFAIIAATQASLYGLIRVCFTIYGKAFDMQAIAGVLVALAFASIFIGATMTLIQSSLTRAIAYAAVAEMGYILLGIGTALFLGVEGHGAVALKGGIFHIFNDALDMGLLFLAAGSIIYATKERDMNNLGGLARRMRFTTIFFLIGLLAASGMPPMNGFASKILIYESTYALNPILAIIAILSSILMLAIFVRIFYSVFLGPENPNLKDIKEVPKPMLISMACISLIIILFGIFPSLVVDSIVNPAVHALSNVDAYIGSILGGV